MTSAYYSLSPTEHTRSYRHTALSEISNRIVWGKYYYALFDITHYFFFPMWGLQILVFSLQDSLVQKQKIAYQLWEDNAHILAHMKTHFQSVSILMLACSIDLTSDTDQ